MPAPAGLLLRYYLATEPQPLQAGTESVQASGTINLHMAAAGMPVFADEILIAVPVGAGGLFAATPVCSVNTAKWMVTSTVVVKGETIGLIAGQDYARFTLDCQDPADYDITYNLVAAIEGATASVEGSYQLQVLERSGTVGSPETFTSKTGAFTAAVVPPRLYLSNFVAFAAGAPSIPKTEFDIGRPVSLAWESNGTWFQVYRKGAAAPVWSGSRTTCTIPGGAGTDTTFVLIASMTGDPGLDRAGFHAVVLVDSLTVTIRNPALTPTSVTTSDAVVVGGALAVAGRARVTGATTLGALDLSGGATMAGGATIAGGLTIMGGLTGTAGPVALLGAARGLAAPATYYANSDGFVIGWIAHPAQGVSFRCFAWITAATESVTVRATGGNLAGLTYITFEPVKAWNDNSLLLPVRKGQNVTVSVEQASGNEAPAQFGFFWLPFGNDGGRETLTDVSEDTRPISSISEHVAARVPKSKHAHAAGIVDLIGELTGRSVAGELRTRLTDALLKLAVEE